jgi:hypothetical protein
MSGPPLEYANETALPLVDLDCAVDTNTLAGQAVGSARALQVSSRPSDRSAWMPTKLRSRMFEKRRRKKDAKRRFDKAIAAEWARHGVRPSDRGGPAFRQAVAEAAFPSREYSELAMDVVRDATARLSDEDRFIITGGREGSDPFAEKAVVEAPRTPAWTAIDDPSVALTGMLREFQANPEAFRQGLEESYRHRVVEGERCALCRSLDVPLAMHVIEFAQPEDQPVLLETMIPMSRSRGSVRGSLGLCETCATPCERCQLPIARKNVLDFLVALDALRPNSRDYYFGLGNGVCEHAN